MQELSFSGNHHGPVTSLTFSMTTQVLVTSGADGAIAMWDPATGNLRHLWSTREPIECIDGDLRQMIVASAARNGAKLWTPGRSEGEGIPLTFAATAIRFRVDGSKLVVGAATGILSLHDLPGARILISRKVGGPITAIAIHGGGTTIAVGTDEGTVLLFDRDSLELGVPIEYRDGALAELCFSPDGALIATGARNGVARIWKVDVGRPVAAILNPEGVRAIAFSGEGRQLITGGLDGRARTWDSETGTARCSSQVMGSVITALAYDTRSRRLFTGHRSGMVAAWDLESHRCLWSNPVSRDVKLPELFVQQGHAGGVVAAGFSSNATLAATLGDDRTVHLWDANEGRELAWFSMPAPKPLGLSFDPAGDRIVIADGLALRIWSIRQRAFIRPVKSLD